MKLNKRSRWIIVVTVLVVLSMLIFTQFDSARATFNDMHAFTVLLRVETEIMQKTPAGQYYESLFWKHNDELMRISFNHPENEEEFWRVTRLFIPGLEAFLDGEGDTVQITSEQVESLKAELNWFASVGGPALREDIEKEQQRFPLDILVGMTMNEAFDFINSSWTPDSAVPQTLVPNSNGKWAYYVHNGVYLEYPSSFYVQKSESEQDFIYFVPSSGMPEQWSSGVMKVRFLSASIQDKEKVNPRSWYAPEDIKWENPIQVAEFQGVEFIIGKSGVPIINLHAFLYNEENQLAVDIWILLGKNTPIVESLDYSELVNQKFEYFQHMVDSIQIRMP